MGPDKKLKLRKYFRWEPRARPHKYAVPVVWFVLLVVLVPMLLKPMSAFGYCIVSVAILINLFVAIELFRHTNPRL